MKRMKPERKRLIVSIIAVLLVIAMVIGLIAPFVQGAESENSGIAVEANIGFDGYAKIDRESFLDITLSNNSGKNFNGEVQVLLSGYKNSYSNEKDKYRAIGEKIELPDGSIKKVELSGYVNSVIDQNMIIRLVDDDDNTVLTKEIPLVITDNEKMWYGEISEGKSAIAYLKPQYYGIESYDFDIDRKNLSENAKALNNFDCIVINDYDTDEFTDKQVEAIRGWTDNGGILIIGTGKNREKVLSNLEFAEKNGSGAYGKGRIYLFEEDLGNSEFSDAVLQNEIVNIYNRINPAGNYNNSNYENSLLGYTQTLPDYSDWLIVVIIVIIYGYILFISPVLYLILKKKDKREDALKIIPISALCITVFIYFLSFIAPYKKPIASVVSIIDLNKDEKSALIGINMLSPEKGTVKCSFEKNDMYIDYIGDSTNVMYNSYYYNHNGDTDIINKNNKEKIELKNKIINGNESYAEVYDKEKWGETYIRLSKEVGSVGELKVTGDFKDIFDFDMENNTGYDLEDVIIMYGGKYYNTGDIKNGEKKNLRLESKNTANVKSYVYDLMYDQNRYFEQNFNSSERYKKQMHQELANGILNSMGNEVVIIGFNDSEIIEGGFKINGSKPNMATTNAFIYNVDAYAFNDTNEISEDDIWNDKIAVGYPTDYSEAESYMHVQDKYGDAFDNNIFMNYIYETKKSGDIEFEVVPSYNSGNTFIVTDTSKLIEDDNIGEITVHAMEVYYPASDSWEELNYNAEYGDEILDTDGSIKIRVKDCSEGELIVAPLIFCY